MKLHLAVAAVFLMLSSALYGQWFEKRVYVPDSLCGITDPKCLVYDSQDDRVFCSGNNGWVLVIDALTNHKMARVAVPGTTIAQSLWLSRWNRLYFASDAALVVMDGPTHSVIDTVNTPTTCLSYSGLYDKLFFAGGSAVKVLRCSTGTVIATIDVGSTVGALVTGADGRRVYAACSGIDSIVCINAMTHQIIRSLPAPDNPKVMVYSPVSNKVYCASPNADSVLVIDCAGDTAVRRLFVGDYPTGLVYASAANRLYCANSSSNDIAVIDCNSDTVAKRIALPSSPLYGSCWDSVRNRLYVACTDGELIYVIDCAADSLADSIITSGLPGVGKCMDTDNSTLYWGGRYPSDLLVIDPAAGIQVDTTPLGRGPAAAAWNRLSDKTFVACERELAVIDGSSRSLVGMIPLGKSRPYIIEPDSMHTVYVLRRSHDRLWDDQVAAVDTRSDTLLDWAVDVDSCDPVAGSLLWNPRGNKLYCASFYTNQLLVIDCATAQIADRIPIPGPWKLSRNSADNKVYCSSKVVDSLYILDSDADTVEAVLGLGYPGYGHLLAYDAVDNKEYALALGIGTLAAIDGSGNYIVDSLKVNDYGPSLFWNSAANKLYSGDALSNRVTVVDCARDSIVARDTTYGDPVLICADSANNKVYVGIQYPNRLAVISGVNNGMTDTFPLLASPLSVTWDAVGGCIYVAEGSAGCIAVFADDHVALQADERPQPRPPAPTIVRGVLLWEADGTRHAAYGAELLDVSGRKVLDLRPGPNSTKGLAPGVYFVHEGGRGKTQKVVIVE